MGSSFSDPMPRLGVGIYRVTDIARYTSIPHTTVYSWFRSRSLFAPEMGKVSGASVASFNDLIDTLIARDFRKQGVPMKEVRKAYESLKARFETPHPFCHKGLYTDGKKVIVDVAKAIGDRALQEAVSGQRLFTEIRGHLINLSFSEATSMVTRWNIAPSVVIDPGIAMGQPVLRGTGVTTFVVGNAFYANGRNEVLVAGMYGLSGGQVLDAVRFEEEIRSAA